MDVWHLVQPTSWCMPLSGEAVWSCLNSGIDRRGFQLVYVWQFWHEPIVGPCGLVTLARGPCPASEPGPACEPPCKGTHANASASMAVIAALPGIPEFLRKDERRSGSPF